MPIVSQFAEPLTYWLIAVNLLAFAAFGIDKARSQAGGWRIGEATLINLALLGGTPGAFAGRRAFRHKTRTESFGRRLRGAVLVQVLGTAGLAAVWWADEVPGGAEWDGEQAEAGGLHLEAAATSFPLAAAGGGRLVGCDAVRAAGRAPLYRGDPDYHPGDGPRQ